MFMIFNWITACFDSRRRRRSAGSRRAYSACFGCTTARQTHPRFEALESRVLLTNTFTLVSNDIGFTIASWGDMNNDGWVDLYDGNVVHINDHGSFSSSNRVLLPNGGNSRSIWGDYDNDGFLDLFDYTSARLFRNVDGTAFEEMTELIPALPMTVRRAATWGDFNGDSFLDLYIGGYESPPQRDAVLRPT